MGKKKPYGKIVLTVVLALMIAFTGFASAEQQWYPGFIDNEGELGTDGKSWRIGHITTWVIEGATSDDFETTITATDPTADNAIVWPDESGTVLTTGGLTGVIPLSDAKALIGNSSGLGIEQTLSLSGDVTGAFLNSGDAATTIVANAVGASELNRIVNTLIIAGGTASNAVGNNSLYNAAGYTVMPRNNNATSSWIANTTLDVNGNVTVFINDTLASNDDFTVEIVRWAP